MKKFLRTAVTAVALTFGFGSNLFADDNDTYELSGWQEELIMYVPNRIMDALDIFSLSIGAGPVIGADVRATRLVTVGAGAGAAVKVVKGYHRQYGVELQEGYNIDFLMYSIEKQQTDMASRFINRIDIDRTCIVTPDDRVYDFYEGARDYWSIGASLALILDVDVDVHPVEIFDFVTGIFCIDLCADDMSVYDVAGTREIELK